jgi:hypothetical protein
MYTLYIADVSLYIAYLQPCIAKVSLRTAYVRPFCSLYTACL